MKKLHFALVLFVIVSTGHGQSVEKLIKEESVTQVINILAAEDMMGRPASQPELIEKATTFIENELLF